MKWPWQAGICANDHSWAQRMIVVFYSDDSGRDVSGAHARNYWQREWVHDPYYSGFAREQAYGEAQERRMDERAMAVRKRLGLEEM
jgi:hypothetical protein